MNPGGQHPAAAASGARLAVVLVEPQIPANTGNIARTCVTTGTTLHLVEPLGFSLAEKQLKRAGLDYWFDLDLRLWPDLDSVLQSLCGRPIFYSTTKTAQSYAACTFPPDSVFVFGKETKGLPEALLETHPERCIRIPMCEGYRCLNLSNSVAIILYEALKQNRFPAMW